MNLHPRRRPAVLAGLALVVLAAAVALAAFQPWKAVVDDRVDEAAPATLATAPPPATTVVSVPAPTTVAAAAAPPTTTAAAPVATAAPAAPVPTTAAVAPAVPPTVAPTVAAPVPTSAAPPAPPAEPAATSFRSKAHDTSGTVRLLVLPDGSRVLRLEDLDTSNGPDLKVVLSPDPEGYADGAISLGTLKGNKGSANYAVPADVDLASFRSVVVWCKRFTVDFGVAPLPV